MEVIEKLEQLLQSERFYELYELLKANINSIDQNNNVVLRSINALVDHGYIDDAEELLGYLSLDKSKRVMKDILKNKIKDKRNINNYDEEVYKVYFEARDLGHNYYNHGDIESAYYAYEWGYYVTENPIFLYYMGKMIYKKHNYPLAEEFFNQYLKYIGEKASKAYLYLGRIASYYNRIDEATNCFELGNTIIEIERNNYYIHNYSSNMAQESNASLTDYYEVALECPEFDKIRDLYIRGKEGKADKLLSKLRDKSPKTLDDKLALGLLKRNRKIYQNRS